MATGLDAAARRRDAYLAGRAWIEAVAEDVPALRSVPVSITAMRQAKGLGFAVARLPAGTQAVLAGRTIYLSTSQGAVRARFSVAHEVAHSVLGTGHGDDPLAEDEADACAAALLVPHGHLVARVREMGLPAPMTADEWAEADWHERVVARLARLYYVSYPALALSLLDAGLVLGEAPWERPGGSLSPRIVRALLDTRRRLRALDGPKADARRRAALWHARLQGLEPALAELDGRHDPVGALERLERAGREEASSCLRLLDVDPMPFRYLPLPRLWDLVAAAEWVARRPLAEAP